jgi:thiamine phosphate synthase YjbQ (UPF0047 family)
LVNTPEQVRVSGLPTDYEDWLEELASHARVSQYRHDRTGEDNGDAHLKRQIVGARWWLR